MKRSWKRLLAGLLTAAVLASLSPALAAEPLGSLVAPMPGLSIPVVNPDDLEPGDGEDGGSESQTPEGSGPAWSLPMLDLSVPVLKTEDIPLPEEEGEESVPDEPQVPSTDSPAWALPKLDLSVPIAKVEDVLSGFFSSDDDDPGDSLAMPAILPSGVKTIAADGALWETTKFGTRGILPCDDGGQQINTDDLLHPEGNELDTNKLQAGGYFQLEYTANKAVQIQFVLGNDWDTPWINSETVIEGQAYTAKIDYDTILKELGTENLSSLDKLLVKNCDASTTITLTRLAWFGDLEGEDSKVPDPPEGAIELVGTQTEEVGNTDKEWPLPENFDPDTEITEGGKLYMLYKAAQKGNFAIVLRKEDGNNWKQPDASYHDAVAGYDGIFCMECDYSKLRAIWTDDNGEQLSFGEIGQIGFTNWSIDNPMTLLGIWWVPPEGGESGPETTDAPSYEDAAVDITDFKGRSTLPISQDREMKTNTDPLNGVPEFSRLQSGGYFLLQMKVEEQYLSELKVRLTDSNWSGSCSASVENGKIKKVKNTENTYVAIYPYEELNDFKEGIIIQIEAPTTPENVITLEHLAWFGDLTELKTYTPGDYTLAAWTTTSFGGKETLAGGANTDDVIKDFPMDRAQAGGYFQLELTSESKPNVQINLRDANWQWHAVETGETLYAGDNRYFLQFTYDALVNAWGSDDLTAANGLLIKNNGGESFTLTRLSWFGELKVFTPTDYAEATWTTTDFGGKATLAGGTNTDNVMGDFPVSHIQSGYLQLELTADVKPDVQLNLQDANWGWHGVESGGALYAGGNRYFLQITYEQLLAAWGADKDSLSGLSGLIIKNNGSGSFTLTRLSWFGALVESDFAGGWDFRNGAQDWTCTDPAPTTIAEASDGSYVFLADTSIANGSWSTSNLQNGGTFQIPEGSMISLDVYIERSALERSTGTKSIAFSGGWGVCDVVVDLQNMSGTYVTIDGTTYYKYHGDLPIGGGGDAVSPLVIQLVVQNGAFDGKWGIANVSIQKNGGIILGVEADEKTKDDFYFKYNDGTQVETEDGEAPALDLTGGKSFTTKDFELPSGSAAVLGPPELDMTLALGRGDWSEGAIQVTVLINRDEGGSEDRSCVITLTPDNFSSGPSMLSFLTARAAGQESGGANGFIPIQNQLRFLIAEAGSGNGRTSGEFEGGVWMAEPGSAPGTCHITATYTRFTPKDVHSVTLEVSGDGDSGCNFNNSLMLKSLTLTNGSVEPTFIGTIIYQAFGLGYDCGLERIPYTWDFVRNDLDGWCYHRDWDNNYSGAKNTHLKAVDGMLRIEVDWSQDKDQSWSSISILQNTDHRPLKIQGANHLTFDFIYDPAKWDGKIIPRLYSGDAKIDAEGVFDEDSAEEIIIDGVPYKKVPVEFSFTKVKKKFTNQFALSFVGINTSYKGFLYLANMTIDGNAPDPYVDSRVTARTATRISGDSAALTVNGQSIPYADSVQLADPNADAATVALYQYLKAVAQSDAALYGHMEDTVLKAGSAELSASDTMDLTGSLSAIDSMDCGGLFSGYADKYKARHKGTSLPKGVAGDVKAAALLTNESMEQGTIMTISMHMPNFAYAKLTNPNAAESYERYSYPVDSYTLTGSTMVNLLPGGLYNDAFKAYLDLVADYAKQVNGPVLFRPLHENTGSWFWWGKAFCDAETYKSVYKYVVEYLRDEKGVHNFLYLYGPGSEAATLEDYAERYPGDAYVDMVGFDTYDNADSHEDTANFMKAFANTVRLTDQFAKEHGKLFAVTETGVNMYGKQPEQLDADWFEQIQDIITAPDIDCAYYMTWSNYSTENFFTPYAAYKENSTLHGHFMMDPFIRFYNRADSIFAADQKKALSVTPNAPTVTGWGPSGFITSPVGGGRILEPATVTARLSQEGMDISFVISNGTEDIRLDTEVNGKLASAPITAEQLQAIGETVDGRIALYMGEEKLCEYSVVFNIAEEVRDPLVVDDFHSYYGSADLLTGYWSTNMASGSGIELTLVNGAGQAQTDYGMSLRYTEPTGGWAGATVNKETDWSSCDALQFWTVPDGKQQKTVIQIKANNKVYEMYMNLYDEYNAMAGKPVLVTIPFSQIEEQNTGEKNFVENCSKVTEFGLWVNAIENEFMVDGVVSGTILYDDIHAIQGSGDTITFQPAGGRFTDVAPNAWYHDYVEAAAEQGLMTGVSSTGFAPGASMTRAMMAQVLYSMADHPDAADDGALSDVPAGAWYAPAVSWAYQAGIIQGYGGGLYGPADLLDREQAVSFLYGYAKYKGMDVSASSGLTAFPDANAVSDWAEERMRWALSTGIVSGTDTGRLDPAGAVTRAQMAAMLTKFASLNK